MDLSSSLVYFLTKVEGNEASLTRLFSFVVRNQNKNRFRMVMLCWNRNRNQLQFFLAESESIPVSWNQAQLCGTYRQFHWCRAGRKRTEKACRAAAAAAGPGRLRRRPAGQRRTLAAAAAAGWAASAAPAAGRQETLSARHHHHQQQQQQTPADTVGRNVTSTRTRSHTVPRI